MNNGTVSTALQQAYQQNVQPRLALRFSLDGTNSDDLDGGNVSTAVKQAFTANALPLSDTGPYQVLTTQPGNMWLLIDQGNALSFDIRKYLAVNIQGVEQFKLPPSLMSDLDAASASAALIQEFKDYGIALSPATELRIIVRTPGAEWLLLDSGTMHSYDITVETHGYVYQGSTLRFSIPATVVRQINPGDPPPEELLLQFTSNGVNLSSSVQANLVTAGTHWQLVDSDNNVTYDIYIEADLDVFHAPTFDVEVVAHDAHWLLRDTVNTLTFDIKPDANNSAVLNAQQLISTMPLKDGVAPNPAITYLDIGVETKGFIYVLSYEGTGSQTSDYHLDIYNPDGTWLVRTPENEGDPGINGARMVVDQWRNLYTLNYEAIVGPDNRTEPSISTWIPSTPSGNDND